MKKKSIVTDLTRFVGLKNVWRFRNSLFYMAGSGREGGRGWGLKGVLREIRDTVKNPQPTDLRE